MRNNDPIFWPNSSFSQSLRQSMEKNYTDSINILQTQWYQADLDDRFTMSDQDLWGLIFPGVATYRGKLFNFNLINRVLQMISGYQRRNRKSTICIPTLSPMQKTADQLTKCLYHVHNQAGAYGVYSDAFEKGALTQGMGLISIYKDTTNDPVSGDIKLKYVDFKSILIDPYFRSRTLDDCRFIWTRQFFDRLEASLLYPQFADEILNLPKGTYRDDKFYYMPEVYQIQFPNLIAFDEYWYLSQREATYLIDRETEECQEWEGTDEDFKMIKIQFKDRLKIIKKNKPTVRRAIIINDRVLVDEPNPYGLDRYPYVPFLGYFSPDTPYYAYKFRGVVRDLRDAQYLFNRRKVTDLQILESQQMGLKVKKGALVTPDDALNQGNGRVLSIDPKFQMSDVEPMPIIPPAPTMIQMEEQLKTLIMEISGVNEELLGSAVDDKAGILSMLRQGAGLTTLQKLFDQFDESQRLCGDIIVEMIQKNWSYGKIRRIIGEDPTAEFDNKAFFRYGCKVVPGVLTESQAQLEVQQLLYAKEMGAPIDWSDILPKMTIQGKDELLEKVKAREEAQGQQAQAMAQLQMQQLAGDNAMKQGYSQAQQSLAAERLAKIQLDQTLNFERLNRAEEDKTGATLNLVKAIKEIQNIDLDQFQKALSIVQSIEQKNEQAVQQSLQMQQPNQQLQLPQEQQTQQLQEANYGQTI
jgi:hypothetical protein